MINLGWSKTESIIQMITISILLIKTKFWIVICDWIDLVNLIIIIGAYWIKIIIGVKKAKKKIFFFKLYNIADENFFKDGFQIFGEFLTEESESPESPESPKSSESLESLNSPESPKRFVLCHLKNIFWSLVTIFTTFSAFFGIARPFVSCCNILTLPNTT